jgi:tetratricopeptide (TPR) repeat protein
MKRPQLVSKGTLNRVLKDAEQAWHTRDFQKNIDLLETASRLDPANLQIAIHLGHAYGMRYNYEASEYSFQKAVRLSSRQAETLLTIALKCREFSNPEMAENYFRQALTQNDASPETFVHLAELYERMRRIDEANILIDRALEISSRCTPALLLRARLSRHAGQLEEAEKLLRSLLCDPNQEMQIRGYYELGTVLDRQGRYNEAMSAILEAKSLLRANASYHLDALRIMRMRLRLLRENLDPDMLHRWISLSPDLQPIRKLALLCGHPRSGTTLLEQVLDSHPSLISAEETEIFHNEAYIPLTRNFPPDAPMLSVLESSREQMLLQSRENYFCVIQKFLGAPIADRLLIDKNPSLTFLIPHFLRIFPEAKVLVALRDPRDVCLSRFMQPFYPVGQVSSAYLSLSTTVDEYTELTNMWQNTKLLVPTAFLQVRYEDMVANLETVARKVLSFLAVPWDERVLRFHEHARHKMVRSPTYADVTQKVFKRSRGRWQNYQHYLEPHLAKLEPFVRMFAYN